MRAIKNTVLLKIDTSMDGAYKNDKGEAVKGHNGYIVFAEAVTYNKYEEKNQLATVAFPPTKYTVNKDYLPVNLKQGDTVLVSHLASEKEHEVEVNGETYYAQNISDIYAVLKDGECFPILNYVFLEAVLDSEDELKKNGVILKTAPSKKPREGIIKYLSPFASSIGLEQGMRVMFPRSFRYEIKFFGNTYYMLHAEDIFAKVEC